MNLNSLNNEKKEKKEEMLIHKMRKQLEKEINKLTTNEYNEIFNIISDIV